MEPRPSNVAQKTSPSYRLAALDGDFILGDGMRGVRFMLEYEKAEAALRRWNIRSTVVVIGSARVREDGPGQVMVSLQAGGTRLLARITQHSARALQLQTGMPVFAQIKGVALLD